MESSRVENCFLTMTMAYDDDFWLLTMTMAFDDDDD